MRPKGLNQGIPQPISTSSGGVAQAGNPVDSTQGGAVITVRLTTTLARSPSYSPSIITVTRTLKPTSTFRVSSTVPTPRLAT